MYIRTSLLAAAFILLAVSLNTSAVLAQSSLDPPCVWWLSSLSTNDTVCSRDTPCFNLHTALEFTRSQSSPCPPGSTRYIYLIPDGVYYKASNISYNDENYNPENPYSDTIISSAAAVDVTQNITLPLPPSPVKAVIDASNKTFHARFFTENVNYTFIGLTFQNASAGNAKYGFPFYTHYDSIVAVNFVSCIFQNNYGVKGGVIFWNPIRSSFISNCQFLNNVGSVNSTGGGIVVRDNNVPLLIDNCTFSGNTAPFGGALYIEDARVLVSNSNFSYNHAINGSGGAAYVESAVVNVSDNWRNIVFYNNTAINGGALYDSKSTLEYNTITFELNYASANGGAVHLQDTVSSVVQSVFHNNYAYNGGAVFTFDSIPKTRQLLIKSSNFTSNKAQIGGALYCNSTTAGLNVQNHFAGNAAAGNKEYNAEFCSKTCLTAFGQCGCMNGCGLPPPPSTASGTETKIALGIFIPITVILLGIVCFLLWKTNKNKQKMQQRAYDEIRLQPSSPNDNDL